jgi:large subunit ribosomal protein L4
MSTLKIYDQKGGAVGDFDLPDALLVLDRGDQAVHDAVVAHLAAHRSGTASTLLKGEVAGSNKKPWRQKGTGRARAGYRQSPVWRGGGIVFGPKPRDYEVKINRKVAQLAFRRAFSDKVQSGSVRLVDSLTLAEAKTRSLVQMLRSLKLEKGVLILVDRVDETLGRASRNLSGVEVARARDVSVYQLLKHRAVIVSRAGMEDIRARLGA